MFKRGASRPEVWLVDDREENRTKFFSDHNSEFTADGLPEEGEWRMIQNKRITSSRVGLVVAPSSVPSDFEAAQSAGTQKNGAAASAEPVRPKPKWSVRRKSR